MVILLCKKLSATMMMTTLSLMRVYIAGQLTYF